MSNPARQKGTKGENEILETLMPIFPAINRSEAGRESQDFVNTGNWTIEVKNRKRWELFKWIRRARRVAPNGRWIIACIHGDRRTVEGAEVGKVAVCDWDTMLALLAAYETLHRQRMM